MVNGSFVFGMDDDDDSVFDRTVEWAIDQGIETATFHILTPYPGTALYRRMESEGRILHREWDRYDTRHVVYRTRGMSAEELEAGYWSAYRDFYRCGAIWRGASRKREWVGRARHFAYAAGWKKFEPLWDWLIRTRRVFHALPLLEGVLDRFGRHPAGLVEPREPAIAAAGGITGAPPRGLGTRSTGGRSRRWSLGGFPGGERLRVHPSQRK